MRRALRFFFLLLTLCVVFAAIFVWGYGEYVRPGPIPVAADVVIKKGSGLEAIAGQLADAGIISDPVIFRLGARLTGADKTLKAGEYSFPAAISPMDAVALLQSGKTVVRRLTVAEGLTTRQVIGQLVGTDGLTGDVSPGPWLAEGVLQPETYHFSYGDRRDDIVRRMHVSMKQTLAELWKGRTVGLPLETPTEALILASIVERETALPTERPVIAAVFINRLKRGMRLQSDPTVVYGLSDGEGTLGRPLTRTDLKAEHVYNTYVHRGLPPGPISNPGRASLAAVLNPADNKALYFVADGTGGHVFANSLKAHNRNVAKWRRFQRQQNGNGKP